MDNSGRNLVYLVWATLLLVILTVALVFTASGLKMRARGTNPLPVVGPVHDFGLTNQDGRKICLADLRGSVWVADIIFTRCPGPCANMTRQMKELQSALPSGSGARLVTLTTDPVFDTPQILKVYGERFGADFHRWMFLTGTKKQIADLAVGSLKLTAIENKPEERESSDDLFVHSTVFVVVDKKGQLRGVFETTGKGVDPKKVRQQILTEVWRLEGES